MPHPTPYFRTAAWPFSFETPRERRPRAFELSFMDIEDIPAGERRVFTRFPRLAGLLRLTVRKL
jgi:hypothetical protein